MSDAMKLFWENMFSIYQMDYQFGWYNKDQMKNLVVQGFLTADGYKKIVGDDYVAPTQPTQPAQPAGK